jgi:hypothetical protein
MGYSNRADPDLNALALEMNARAAFADHDLAGSRQHIQKALAIVEELDIPVAARRAHAASWELCPNKKEAERHRRSRPASLRLHHSIGT